MPVKRVLVVLLCLIAGALAAAAPASAQMYTDRPGGDYASFAVRSGNPTVCYHRCERDSRCRAWSFSYPRTKRIAATCWLKKRVPRRIADTCCVSGVRGAAMIRPRIGAIEYSIDRAGGDYHSFAVKRDPHGAPCAQACKADKRCRAWTYARPGYSGARARCFLKQRITPPRPKPCCISGVVR